MPPPNENQPIILKRRKVVVEGGHHGGAWKVAYADFVTAMMAFFLLMWLLNAVSEEQRKGLADYFNPSVPISRTSAGGAGMLEGRAIFAEAPPLGDRDQGVPPSPVQRDGEPAEGDRHSSADAPRGGAPSPGAAAGERAGDGAGGQGEAAGPDPAEVARRAEQARLEHVGREIAEAAAAAANKDGAIAHHFYLRITPEGLVIEIIEDDGEPLFASASSAPAPLLPMLVDVLVPVLRTTGNEIAVVGHTDAVPFGGQQYSNWELSADRANAARRLLTRAGLPESRIVRVTGKAAVEPLVADPLAPQNRRISVTLLRRDVH
jgi:chemotaxis protein MotB